MKKTNKLGKIISLMGLLIRKTVFPIAIAGVLAGIAAYFINENLCLAFLLILSVVFLMLPFGEKAKTGRYTFMRFPFERKEFSVIYAIVAFMELHFGLLVFKLMLILFYGFVCGLIYDNHVILFMHGLFIRDCGLIGQVYPYTGITAVVVQNAILIVIAIIVARFATEKWTVKKNA